MTRRKPPTYDKLVGTPTVRGRTMHPVTVALIALAPGDVYQVAVQDGDMERERNRITSRLRSVKIETGGRYTVRVDDGKLYVVRLRAEDSQP